MPDNKTRVFLDTSVILQALRGDQIARTLFTPELEKRVTYFVDPVVLQELLLSSSAESEQELHPDEILRHLEVVGAEAPLRQEQVRHIQAIRNRAIHANNLVILSSARNYDILLTYDNALRAVGKSEGVNTSTPEDFLAKFGAEK